MTTTSPPPSSLRRTAELDSVRDVLLLESEEHLRAPPVPRHEGPKAIRGAIEARLSSAISAEELLAEREASLELARIHFERGLDLDRAVQLLHRALEIEDDLDLRFELARQLAMMGRHVEAGHVLRDGEPREQQEVVDAWLRSGDAYVRAGDAMEAIATYREVAMLAPDDPRPFMRIAAIAYWDRDAVPVERAADAFLEAAKRYTPGSDGQLMSVARAFEIAPAYARSTEAYTKSLHAQGRYREADEIWRAYGATSGHGYAVSRRAVQWALDRGDVLAAFTAALDTALSGDGDDRIAPLENLLANETAMAGLAELVSDAQPFDAGMLAAVRTKSSMGRADAFAKLAQRFHGDLRALLLAFAAESYASAGNLGRAAETAVTACAASVNVPRAHAVLLALDGNHEAIGASEVEMATAHMAAHAWIHHRMATQQQLEGQHRQGAIWTRYAIELRMGDIGPLQMLLDRAIHSEDAELIDESIEQVLSKPSPHQPLAVSLSRAIGALARLNHDICMESVRRVLMVLGPGPEPLYSTLVQFARDTDDAALEIALCLRRAVSDEVGDDQRASYYLNAAELCLAHGDAEAAAEHAYCAAAHSGPPEKLSALLETLRDPVNELVDGQRSDALLASAHASAWSAEQRDPSDAIQPWRRLGAMRWDLAGDQEGAEEAYFVSCAHDPEAGPYRYARDLEDRAGAERAISIVVDRAVAVGDEGDDPALCGRLYAAAARVAADKGLHELAMNAALAAIQTDPSRGDAVAIVEKIATGDEGLAALNFVYNTLADAALGRYGFRAAHYRAARQLESRQAYEHALRHAILAFEAVPSVGASYRMLLRLASRAGDDGAAVRTLSGVAASFPPDEELQWLLRAAELATEAPGGVELQLDLLLKALALRQSAELVDHIRDAAKQLGDELDEVVRLRLERAVAAALPKVGGMSGASTAVALGVLAAEPLAKPRLAVQALQRALDIDGHDTNYERVLPTLDTIALDTEAARQLLETINELRARGGRPLANGLREITSALYLKLSDVPGPSSFPPASERALSSDAPSVSEPEPTLSVAIDDELLNAASELPEPSPVAADAQAIEVQTVEADEDTNLAPQELETVPPPVAEPQPAEEAVSSTRRSNSEPVLELHHEQLDGAIVEQEELLGVEEEREERAQRESDIEEILGGAHDVEILTDRPPSSGRGTDQAADADVAEKVEGLARDEALAEVEYVESKGQLVPSRPPPPLETVSSVPPPTQPSAPPLESEPPPAEVVVDYSPASEQRARERGDHASIAQMLAARARATPNLQQRRLIRLRRAAVLEQRLDRLDLACVELEAILDEVGEDATALRYLADLRDRMGKPARAARLWLRASKQASTLEAKLRDVVRCCEALVSAKRAETARRLLEAARGLPLSTRMVELKVAIARQLGDVDGLSEATAELEALGDPSSANESIPPPAAAPIPLRRRDPAPEQGTPSPPGGAISSRRVFRVAAGKSAGSPREVLFRCRDDFLRRGVGQEGDAKETIRLLRAVGGDLDDAEQDLLTFLLVESLDRVQGAGSAMHELQQHWETLGGTPLVTAAVADRLARRGDLRPALQLYDRVLEQNLQGVRSSGQMALEAAEIAHRLQDEDEAERYLELAALHEDARAGAERRYREWFGRPSDWDSTVESVPGDELSSLLSSEPPDTPPTPIPARRSEPPSLRDLELNDDGDMTNTAKPPPSSSIPSRPPPHPSLRRPPTFPEFVAANEEELFNELITGSFDAGDELVAMLQRNGRPRTHDVLAVRRYQVSLRRGDRRALTALRDAAIADQAGPFARAVEHVLAAFDPAAEKVAPPPLEQLAAQPEAATKLLFGSLDGTINEALALVCEGGIMRRDISEYDFTGTDRVPPVSTTPVGRVYAALSRLLDLNGVRLYHRSRRKGSLRASVALVNPLAAVLSGAAEREGAMLRYLVGSALAAATPPLALIHALKEADAQNLVGALLAGFGPVDEASVAESSAQQMRIAEDLWHMVSSATDQRLRQLCTNRREMTFEAALSNAHTVARRVGLFASGDIVTSIVQTINELDLQVPRPIRGEAVLRELCAEPAVADLFDLAILPEYAEARWASI